MSNVDDRIVSMQFDNENFERRLSSTLDGLDKLSESLKFSGAANGFESISNAAANMNLSGVGDAVQSISDKFGALGAVGFSVIQSLTQQALAFVEQLPQDILSPILGGGKQRALNIEQAKFLFAGLGADVDESMAEAKQAVLGTAFGLDEAAKAAAQLESSGVSLGEQLPSDLRAIAGVAAMTGSQFSEISDIFTQAAGQGKISGYTLERISYRGLNAAAVLAKQLNKTEAEVRDMASNGQIDFATFAKAMDDAFGSHATEANKTFTGSLSNLHAALSRMGAEIQTPRLQQERDIFNAMTPVVDKLHAALLPLLNTFTNLSQIGVTALVGKLNGLNFDRLTAAMPLIAVGVQNMFEGISQFIRAGKDAFRDIFPKSSESIIFRITAAFVKLSDQIKMGDGTVEKVKFVFDAVFSTLNVGWVVIKNIIRVFRILLGSITPLSGGLGDFIVHIARLVQWYTTLFVLSGKIDRFFNRFLILINTVVVALQPLRNAIEDFVKHLFGFTDNGTKKIDQFRDKMQNMFGQMDPKGSQGIFKTLDIFKGKLANLFGQKDAKSKPKDMWGNLFGQKDLETTEAKAEQPLNRFQERLKELRELPERIGAAWDKLHERFQGIFDVLDQIGAFIKTWAQEFIKKIGDAFSQPGSFNQAIDAVNVGLIGGLILLLNNFLKGGGAGNALFGGLGAKIKRVLGNLNETLVRMQEDIKADILMKIATAVGILTISLVALSLINSAALTKALVAVGVGFGELVTTMKALDNIGGDKGRNVPKIIGLSIAMNLMATAMGILSISIIALSHLDPDALAKGVGGMGAALFIMVGAVKLLGDNVPGIIGAAVGMNLIAGAMIVLAGAVKLFSDIKAGDLAKGITAIAVSLAVLTAALMAMPPSGALSGIGLIETAIALTILAGAVKLFGMISWADLAKGMAAIAAALLIMTVAMNALPITTPITAAGLVLLATALTIMAGAVKLMGMMDLPTLAKGIGAILALLLVLAGAMYAMQGALPGAIALVVISGALVVLSEVLEKLGKMKVSEILIALGAVAGALLVLGVSATLLSETIPFILALGIALGVVGGAFFLFGAGVFLVSAGMEKLATSGVGGMKAVMEMVKIFLAAVPTFVEYFIETLMKVAEDFLNSLPLLIRLVGAVLAQLLDTVIQLIPKITQAFGLILTGFFQLVIKHAPEYVQAGIVIVRSLLNGIRDNIGEFTKTAIEIFANFVKAVLENKEKLAKAATDLIVAFLTGIGEHAEEIVTAGVTLLLQLLSGIVDNVDRIVTAVGQLIAEFLQALTDQQQTIITAGFNMLIAFLLGIANNILRVVDVVATIIVTFITELGNQGLRIVAAGADMLVALLSGIEANVQMVIDKGVEIAGKFLDAMATDAVDFVGYLATFLLKVVWGVEQNAEKLVSGGKDATIAFLTAMADDTIDWVNKAADVLIKFLNGLSDAIDQKGPEIRKAAEKLAFSIADGITGGLASKAGDLKDGFIDVAKDGLGILSGPVGFFTGSPSKKTYKIGQWVAMGLAKALSDDTSVGKSAKTLSNNAMSAFQDTLSRIPENLGQMDEFVPTITPVLDLSKVQKDASGISDLMKGSTISPDVSLGNAHSIAAMLAETAKAKDTPAVDQPKEVSFVQNNYSPEALSANQLYKQTKSLIALEKEGLGIKT